MFCSNCGKKLLDGTKFCTACGTKVIYEEPTTEPAPAPAPVETTPIAPVAPVEPEPAPAPAPVAEPVAEAEPVVEPVVEVVPEPVAPVAEPVVEAVPVAPVQPVAPVVPVAEPAPAPVVEPTPAPVAAPSVPLETVIAETPTPAPVAAPTVKAKTPAWAIVIVIILSIAVLAGAGYIVYDQFFADSGYTVSDDDDDDDKKPSKTSSGKTTSGDTSSDNISSNDNLGGNGNGNLKPNAPNNTPSLDTTITNRSWNAYKVLNMNGADADYPEEYYAAFYFDTNGEIHALYSYDDGNGSSEIGGTWTMLISDYYLVTDDDGRNIYLSYLEETDELVHSFGDCQIYYKVYSDQ